MFINNVAIDDVDFEEIQRPIPIYFKSKPCPNCENWCANDPRYTCNYNCKLINHSNIVVLYKDELDIKTFDKTVREEVQKRKDIWDTDLKFNVRIWNENLSKEDKNIKELCENLNKNYTCKFINYFYPICSSDFKPYDKGMERCCQIIKNCYNDSSDRIILTKKCAGFDFWTIYDSFDPNHYWMTHNMDIPNLAKHCEMKCPNDRLIRNYSSNISHLQMTKTSTKIIPVFSSSIGIAGINIIVFGLAQF